MSVALIVLGAILVALGGPPPLQSDAADSENARTLVVKALKQAKWNEEQRFPSRFRSLMTRTMRRFDSDGEITEEDIGDYEVVPIDGAPYERRLTVNGRPLSQEEQEGELDREAEFREELRKQREYPKDQESDEDNRLVFNEELIERYEFILESTETFRGRPSYRISFRPRPGNLPVRRRIDYALNKAKGLIWLDCETLEAARIEFELIEKVRLWWGVFGNIANARGSLDRGPVLRNIWSQLQLETYTDIRVLLSRTRRAEIRQWHSYALIADNEE